VKQLKGSDAGWKVKVGRMATIEEVKKKVEALSGISAGSQRLVLKGKALVDNKTLLDFDIKEGATIHLLKKAGAEKGDAPAAPVEAAPVAVAKAEDVKSPPKKQADPFQMHAKSVGLNAEFWNAVKSLLSNHFSDPVEKQKVCL
jgi:hypothetical protein